MFQNDFGAFDSQGGKPLEEYARVWLCAWKPEGALEARDGSLIGSFRIEEEPSGIIGFKNLQLNPMWIKIDKKWIPLFHHCKGNPFAELHIINKVEYETDIAFGLFKKLRITHRPIRTWIENNLPAFQTLNLQLTCISYVSLLALLVMAEELGNFWGSVAVLLLIHLSTTVSYLVFKTVKWFVHNRIISNE